MSCLKGNKALVVISGKFGERWAELCKCFGIETITIDVENGKAVNPADIEAALKKTPGINGIYDPMRNLYGCSA